MIYRRLLFALSLITFIPSAFAGAESSGGEPPGRLLGPAMVRFDLGERKITLKAFESAVVECLNDERVHNGFRSTPLAFLLRLASMGEGEWQAPVNVTKIEFRSLKIGSGTDFPMPESVIGDARYVLLPQGEFNRGAGQTHSFKGRLLFGTYGSGFCGEVRDHSPNRCLNSDSGSPQMSVALTARADFSTTGGTWPLPAYRSHDADTDLIDQPLLLVDYRSAVALAKGKDDEAVSCLSKKLSARTVVNWKLDPDRYYGK